MKLDRNEHNGITVVTLSERVDGVTAPELEQYLSDLISESRDAVIIDFSALTYISSAGLRALLSAAKKLRQQQRELILSGLAGPVKHVFQLSGFYTLFTVFDTRDQALEKCR